MPKKTKTGKDQTALNAFLAAVSKSEGGKSQSNIGDLRQTLKIVNKKLGGLLYKAIELWAEKPEEAEDGDK